MNSRRTHHGKIGATRSLAALVAVALGATVQYSGRVSAASSESQTITEANTAENPVRWQVGPLSGTAADAFGGVDEDPSRCIEDVVCEESLLEVDIAPGDDPLEKSYFDIEVTTSTPLTEFRIRVLRPAEDWESYQANEPGLYVQRFVGPAPGTWRIQTVCQTCTNTVLTFEAIAGVALPTGHGAPLPPQGTVSFSNVRLPGLGGYTPSVSVDGDGRAFASPSLALAVWRSEDHSNFTVTRAPFSSNPCPNAHNAVAPDDGTLYVACYPFIGPQHVFVSRDHGLTYEKTIIPSSGAGVGPHSVLGAPYLAAAAGGVVYLGAYSHLPAQEVDDGKEHGVGYALLFRSDDHGETFELMGDPTLGQRHPGDCPKAGRLAVDPRDPNTVYIPYRTPKGTCKDGSGSPTYDVWLAKTTDGGRTYTHTLVADDAGFIDSSVFADVDTNGDAYVVWAAEEFPDTIGYDEMHVSLAISTDGGATVSDPIRVDQLADHPSNHGPIVAVREGRVDVAWYTSMSLNRQDPDALWTVAFARSTDATSPTPHFEQSRVSESFVHQGDPYTSGEELGLGNFMGLDIGPDGRASLVWASTSYNPAPWRRFPAPWTNFYGREVVGGPSADLSITTLSASNNNGVREGEKVTITARVANSGDGDAAASSTEFLLDGTRLPGGLLDTPALRAGESVTLSVNWDTRGVKGEHTITATADSGRTVIESMEDNNTRKITVVVRGNKIRNPSFEESSDGSSPDAWSSSGPTGYEMGGSDGVRSVSTEPGGSWTSEAVPIEAGASYDASVVAAGAGGTLLVQQLTAEGSTLSSVAQPLLPTDAFTLTNLHLTALAGAAEARIVLIGGLTGTTTFDDVGLFSG